MSDSWNSKHSKLKPALHPTEMFFLDIIWKKEKHILHVWVLCNFLWRLNTLQPSQKVIGGFGTVRSWVSSRVLYLFTDTPVRKRRIDVLGWPAVDKQSKTFFNSRTRAGPHKYERLCLLLFIKIEVHRFCWHDLGVCTGPVGLRRIVMMWDIVSYSHVTDATKQKGDKKCLISKTKLIFP